MAGRIVFIVCENYEREVAAVVETARFENVRILPFPGECVQARDGKDIIERTLETCRREENRVFVLVSHCFIGKEEMGNLLKNFPVNPLNQCFEMVADAELVREFNVQGGYLLMPGWAARWKDNIKKWGFDRATAPAFFRESFKKLVMLDTRVYPDAEKSLAEMADFVGLPYAVHPVGLSHLRLFLERLVLESDGDLERKKSAASLSDVRSQLAHLAMQLDLIRDLALIGTEEEALGMIIDLFRTLFAPHHIVCVSLRDGEAAFVRAFPESAPGAKTIVPRLVALKEDYAWTENKDGFLVLLRHRDEILGGVELSGFAFPEHKDRYLNTSLTLAKVFGLVIANVRAFQRLREEKDKTEKYLDLATRALKEKELLLKEVNHRVKNNMAVLTSLLGMQARYVQDRSVLEMFEETKNRIRSMGLVHEKLYMAKDLSRVDFSEYLRTLSSQLFLAHHIDDRRIRLSVNMEAVSLNINTAIPCGLIVNELISNAIKHAFPDGRSGEIRIELRPAAEVNKFQLTVSDDGVGFPEKIDFKNIASMGMQEVNLLVAQLDGMIELTRNGGTTFRIVFNEVEGKFSS